jgi:methyl-accepting chemotaxis protein
MNAASPASSTPRLTRGGNPVTRWFADRKVNTKILLIVGTLTVVAVAVGITGIGAMASMGAKTTYLYEQNLVPLTNVGDARQAYMQLRLDMTNALYSPPGPALEKALQPVPADDTRIDAAFGKYTASDMTGRETTVASFTQGLARYRQIRDDELIPALRRADQATALRLRSTTLGEVNKAMAADLDALVKLEADSARVQEKAAMATYRSSRTTLILVLVVGLVVGVALALYVGRLLVGTIRKVAVVAEGLAAGDLTRTSRVEARDELGQMAQALDTASANLRSTVGAVAGNSQTLASASEELSSVSTQISASAEETSTQADVVSAAAEQISHNVQTVATSAEEMGASIREITVNAAEAARVASAAVAGAEDATATVARLAESSAEIGSVVKIITSIAEQTNLLALNATIEAARAGEAGKGFAVVATEVKELAQETARATEDISRTIQVIQTDSTAAAAAIGQIAEVIGQINGFQTTIASAVEEQTATTNEMSRNVSEAATGTGEIARNITGVADAAQSTSAGVAQSREAAENLAEMSADLQKLVGRFTY